MQTIIYFLRYAVRLCLYSVGVMPVCFKNRRMKCELSKQPISAAIFDRLTDGSASRFFAISTRRAAMNFPGVVPVTRLNFSRYAVRDIFAILISSSMPMLSL